MPKKKNRKKSPSRKDDPIIAQHSHFFSPRMPNKPGYYIFINPHLDNSKVSSRICDSIVNNIVPNYDIQQVWMHPKDNMNMWGLRGLQQIKDANKTHWKHGSGTYFSKYDDWNGAAALFSSVINRLKFENFVSWGADEEEEYYACGEWLNPGFFNHSNARTDCAFIMIHYTENKKVQQKRYENLISDLSDALKNKEGTYIEDFIKEDDEQKKKNIIKFWQSTTEKRRQSNLRATFPQQDIFGDMLNGGFLYVRDLNFTDNVNYLYIEGICASKFAGKAKRRGNDFTRLNHDEEYKIIIPHRRSGNKEASPGLEFVDMTNIISYMSGYKGTKLSALIHVINFYFTKFNFKFLQQSVHDSKFKNPQPYPDQDRVDKLVADLSNTKDGAKSIEYQKLFNFDGILIDSAHAHTWPKRYQADWDRRMKKAKGNLGAVLKVIERQYKRYLSHDIGDDGFNQYFIWDSFGYPVLPGQRLTEVTKAIMIDANPSVYGPGGTLDLAPQQEDQSQSQRRNFCTALQHKLGHCVITGGRRSKKRKKKKKSRRRKKKAGFLLAGTLGYYLYQTKMQGKKANFNWPVSYTDPPPPPEPTDQTPPQAAGGKKSRKRRRKNKKKRTKKKTRRRKKGGRKTRRKRRKSRR